MNIMDIPKNSKHRTIVLVKDYFNKDGHNAPNSDVKSLSIGKPDFDSSDYSGKVFRHTGKIWSRKSEEVPINRILDLAILIVSMRTKNFNSTLGGEVVGSDNLSKELYDYLANDKLLDKQFKELKKLLTGITP